LKICWKRSDWSERNDSGEIFSHVCENRLRSKLERGQSEAEVLMRAVFLLLTLAACATGVAELPVTNDPDGQGSAAEVEDTANVDDSASPEDTGPEVDCESLSVADCKAEPACRTVEAFPIKSLGDGEYCVDPVSTEVGCVADSLDCPAYSSWGAATSGDSQCYAFGDCQPDSWGSCADPAMRTTIGC
jgi:hypothetical protein